MDWESVDLLKTGPDIRFHECECMYDYFRLFRFRLSGARVTANGAGESYLAPAEPEAVASCIGKLGPRRVSLEFSSS